MNSMFKNKVEMISPLMRNLLAVKEKAIIVPLDLNETRLEDGHILTRNESIFVNMKFVSNLVNAGDQIKDILKNFGTSDLRSKSYEYLYKISLENYKPSLVNDVQLLIQKHTLVYPKVLIATTLSPEEITASFVNIDPSQLICVFYPESTGQFLHNPLEREMFLKQIMSGAFSGLPSSSDPVFNVAIQAFLKKVDFLFISIPDDGVDALRSIGS